MRTFDYMFLKDAVPGRFVGVCERIVAMKTKEWYHKQSNEGTFSALREKVGFESVESSHAIDGITATEARIRGLLDGDMPETKDEKMIAGYYDAFNLITIQHEKLTFSEELFRNLHRMIFHDVIPPEAGTYKTEDIYIFGMDPDSAEGDNRVRLNPIAAEDIPTALAQMIQAYNTAIRDEEIPEIMLIPCVVLDFLRIQPFAEGNERISRLLTIFLLQKAGLDVGSYISIEKMIEKRKEDYYAALEKSSDAWTEGDNDYNPFISFMLQIFERAYHELDDHFVENTRKKVSKQERIESILMNTYVPVSKSEIMERLPDVSVRTVEVTLKRLLDEDKIMKVGSFRDARYKKKG